MSALYALDYRRDKVKILLPSSQILLHKKCRSAHSQLLQSKKLQLFYEESDINHIYLAQLFLAVTSNLDNIKASLLT